MKKLYLLVTFSFILAMSWMACNSESSSDNTQENPEIDSLKQDSINKANFMAKYNRYYNDIARLIAGLEQTPGSNLANFDTMQVAKEYRKSIGEFFTKLDAKSLSKMRVFSDAELSDMRKDSLVLFYPFSGPDFINANAFFPEAFTTIMLGLEPVGGVPDISDATGDELGALFKALRISIDSLAPLGYFMTNEMSKDFRRVSELNGNIPVITLFMARNNYHILNVKRITIDAQGHVVDSLPGQVDKHDPSDNYISGGMIEYMKPNEYRVRKLYYFSHDVSDESLARTPQLMTFFKSFKIDVALFKAASYLCSWMKDMREFTLNNAKVIVQDDSGIPYSYFDKNQWDMKFYGKYQRTLKVFLKGFFQRDLKQVYDTCKTVKPLDFAFGYGVRIKQSNIMVARKK